MNYTKYCDRCKCLPLKVDYFEGILCTACYEIYHYEKEFIMHQMYVDCIKRLSDCQNERKWDVIRSVYKNLFPEESEK